MVSGIIICCKPYSDILWLYCVLYASHTDTRQNLAVRVFALPILVGGGIQECLFVVVFCLIQVVSTHLLPLSFALSLSPFSAISPLYSCSPLLPSLVLIPTRSLPPSLSPSFSPLAPPPPSSGATKTLQTDKPWRTVNKNTSRKPSRPTPRRSLP